MNRFFYILGLLLAITACDDGNLTIDVIDFSDVTAQKCPSKDVIYKVKDAEMLYIEVPAATFTNDEILEGKKHLINHWRRDTSKPLTQNFRSPSPLKKPHGDHSKFKLDINDAND